MVVRIIITEGKQQNIMKHTAYLKRENPSGRIRVYYLPLPVWSYTIHLTSLSLKVVKTKWNQVHAVWSTEQFQVTMVNYNRTREIKTQQNSLGTIKKQTNQIPKDGAGRPSWSRPCKEKCKWKLWLGWNSSFSLKGFCLILKSYTDQDIAVALRHRSSCGSHSSSVARTFANK